MHETHLVHWTSLLVAFKIADPLGVRSTVLIPLGHVVTGTHMELT